MTKKPNAPEPGLAFLPAERLRQLVFGGRTAVSLLLGFFTLGVPIGCHRTSRSSSSPLSTAPRIAESPPARVSGRPTLTEIGLASWYGPQTPNRRAADGSVFDTNQFTAAHKTLPFGTVARVTNLATNESVVVKITDRGPFVPGRTLDLSLAAAKAIGVYRSGVAKVRIEAFEPPDADPEGRWCVQIGAFFIADDAIQLKNDLGRRYSNAKVIEFTSATGAWVRIYPVPATQAAASRIAGSIHTPDAEPYLVRLN
jgi:rare lipoprotein A